MAMEDKGSIITVLAEQGEGNRALLNVSTRRAVFLLILVHGGLDITGQWTLDSPSQPA
jgi:hypothetical protein